MHQILGSNQEDTDKYKYTVLDGEMAQFSTSMSHLSVSIDELICKKCQLKYHAHKRDQRRSAGQLVEEQARPSAAVEPVAGPSGSGVMEVEPPEPCGMDQPPVISPVFTPTSFTQSPNRRSVFTFPPTFNEPSSGSDDSKDDDSGRERGDPSDSDDDPDYEPSEYEYVPIFRLSIFPRQYCIFGCRSDDLSTVRPAFRAVQAKISLAIVASWNHDA